jgi:hypothetical protein
VQNNGWINFDGPTEAAPPVPTSKPIASAEAILSLYNAPPVPSFPPVGAMYGGGYGAYPVGLAPAAMGMRLPMNGMAFAPSPNYGVNLGAMPNPPPLLYTPGYGVPVAYTSQTPPSLPNQIPLQAPLSAPNMSFQRGGAGPAYQQQSMQGFQQNPQLSSQFPQPGFGRKF